MSLYSIVTSLIRTLIWQKNVYFSVKIVIAFDTTFPLCAATNKNFVLVNSIVSTENPLWSSKKVNNILESGLHYFRFNIILKVDQWGTLLSRNEVKPFYMIFLAIFGGLLCNFPYVYQWEMEICNRTWTNFDLSCWEAKRNE